MKHNSPIRKWIFNYMYVYPHGFTSNYQYYTVQYVLYYKINNNEQHKIISMATIKVSQEDLITLSGGCEVDFIALLFYISKTAYDDN